MNVEGGADRWAADPRVPLPKAFADARGEILPLVDVAMGSALLITSGAGTVRGNHFHQTDWHYCYVLRGSIEYHFRPAGSSQTPAKVLARAGEMIFTPPMVEHAMVFAEETMFLTLSRNPRDQASYEQDLVRVSLLS